MSQHPLGVEVTTGLTAGEASRRLATEGFNDLPSTEHRTLPRIVAGVLSEPMFALLLGAGVVYLGVRDDKGARLELAKMR